ncbi:hypothetical protein IWZ01DRAFT_132843 [Phyllosticta capitalensis]
MVGTIRTDHGVGLFFLLTGKCTTFVCRSVCLPVIDDGLKNRLLVDNDCSLHAAAVWVLDYCVMVGGRVRVERSVSSGAQVRAYKGSSLFGSGQRYGSSRCASSLGKRLVFISATGLLSSLLLLLVLCIGHIRMFTHPLSLLTSSSIPRQRLQRWLVMILLRVYSSSSFLSALTSLPFLLLLASSSSPTPPTAYIISSHLSLQPSSDRLFNSLVFSRFFAFCSTPSKCLHCALFVPIDTNQARARASSCSRYLVRTREQEKSKCK